MFCIKMNMFIWSARSHRVCDAARGQRVLLGLFWRSWKLPIALAHLSHYSQKTKRPNTKFNLLFCSHILDAFRFSLSNTRVCVATGVCVCVCVCRAIVCCSGHIRKTVNCISSISTAWTTGRRQSVNIKQFQDATLSTTRSSSTVHGMKIL